MALATMGSAAVGPPAVNPQRTVRLVDLIDMVIQRSYHDLVILAELNVSGKSDMDRKINIMQYISRTHNYLVRLLALLKWSSNMGKVEKCFSIIAFLEEQSMLFVETADVLARLSRETLANSKLPCYQVSFAIDVLTSKTCPRMPSCIKDRTVREDPLNEEDTVETLAALEHALLYRILVLDRPPVEMRNFVIRRGRVTFTVEDEFRVSLTVMGEDRSMPFRILDLKILVRNRRAGEGKPLVHSQQVLYLIQLLQTRILDNEKPLQEIYDFLHAFCQGLQLEVINSQLVKHIPGIGLDYYRVDAYLPTKELRLSYWEEIGKKEGKPHTITIQAGMGPKLKLVHNPPLPTFVPLLELDIGALMISTIHMRVKQRLEKLYKDISPHFPCALGGLPCLLVIPLYNGASRSHSVQISVDYYSGQYAVHLKTLLTSKHVSSLKDYLNSAVSLSTERIVERLRLLRLELTMELVRLQSHSLHMEERELRRIHGAEAFEQFRSLGDFRAAFHFQKKSDSNCLLIISCHEDETARDGIRLDYHFALVEPSNTGMRLTALIPRSAYFQRNDLQEIQWTQYKKSPQDPMDALKARLAAMGAKRTSHEVSPTKLRHFPAVLDNFAEIVLSGLTQLMISDLRVELKVRGFACDMVLVSEDGTVCLPIIVSHPSVRSCILRRVEKVGKSSFTVHPELCADFILSHLPFAQKEGVSHVSFSYDGTLPAEKLAELFAFDLSKLLGLMDTMKAFADGLKQPVPVKYDGKSVHIRYGPEEQFSMLLSWDRANKKTVLDFHCRDGRYFNPHQKLRSKFLSLVEKGKLKDVCRILQLSSPLATAVKDSMRPTAVHRSVPRSLTPLTTFQFVALSFSNFIVTWRGVHALLIRVMPGPKFVITDIGMSPVAKGTDTGSRPSDGAVKFVPILGLRSFLESLLGKSLIPADVKPDGFTAIDAEFEISLSRFFAALKGYPVQLVELPSK